ncbi:MAG TPA: hypothetical protein VIC27_01595 [Ktedonobacterales bacterium]|jgi:predicted RND superfamily exporter protein
MGMGLVAVLGLASILFFSTILIVAALMMRGQWDHLGQRPQRPDDQ